MLPVAMWILICALLLAACGSSGQKGAGKAAARQQAEAIAFSDCMRAHGVPNFPDPSPGGGFDVSALGAEADSPAFLSAHTACAKLEPGGPVPPRITSSQLYQMAAKARCIRRHGFPNFPDPSLASGGAGMAPPANWNSEAPASIAARKACALVGIAIPGWGAAWFGAVD